MKDKCPYCDKNYCVENVVFNNCESYALIGYSSYTLPCRECGKVIEVTMEKIVRVDSVKKSSKKRDECDW
jgi:Fe2+ or Zn2+ uptake regulation protein